MIFLEASASGQEELVPDLESLLADHTVVEEDSDSVQAAGEGLECGEVAKVKQMKNH